MINDPLKALQEIYDAFGDVSALDSLYAPFDVKGTEAREFTSRCAQIFTLRLGPELTRALRRNETL